MKAIVLSVLLLSTLASGQGLRASEAVAAGVDPCETRWPRISQCILDGLAALPSGKPANDDALIDLSVDLWERAEQVPASCAADLAEDDPCLERLDQRLIPLLMENAGDRRVRLRRAVIVLVVPDSGEGPQREAIPSLVLGRLREEKDDTTLALLLQAMTRADVEPSAELHRELLRHAGEGSNVRRLVATELLLQSTNCPLPEGSEPPKLTRDQLAELAECVQAWTPPADR